MPRSKKASFVEQAAILAVASLFVRFIGFLYRLPLTSLIGDEGNAYYAVGYNIYTFVLIMSSAGLPAAISKLVSERVALKQYGNAHQIFFASLWVAFGFGTIGALFLAIGANWLATVTGYPESVHAIRTLSPTILIVAIMAVFRGYFQGMRNTIPTALSQIVEQIVNAVCSVWLAYMFFDATRVELAAAGGTAGTGIGAAAGLLVVVGIYTLVAPAYKKRIHREYKAFQRNAGSRGAYTYTHDRYQRGADPRGADPREAYFLEPRSKLAIDVLKTSLPIIVGTAIFSIASFIDMSMVSERLAASGAFTYEEITTLYGQLTGKYVLLTTLPVSLSTALATAAIPSIAGSHVIMDRTAVKSKVNMALRLSMIISIPAAVGLGVLSDPILLLLFPKYAGGGLLLKYGVVSIIFLALVQIVTGILQGVGRVSIPVIGAFFGTLVKIPLNYFLIANPQINVIGAVISTCACYLVAAIIDLVFLRKYTRIIPDFTGSFIKPLLSATIMGLACYISYNAFMYLSDHNTVSVLFSIMIGLVVYVLFMVLIEGFRREDLKMLPMGTKIARMLRM